MPGSDFGGDGFDFGSLGAGAGASASGGAQGVLRRAPGSGLAGMFVPQSRFGQLGWLPQAK